MPQIIHKYKFVKGVHELATLGSQINTINLLATY